MFALVALLAFYAGGNNISKAFKLAAQTGWSGFALLLLALGVVLLAVGVACVLQAMKDLKEKEKNDAAKKDEEKEKRQQQFYYDEFSGGEEN